MSKDKNLIFIITALLFSSSVRFSASIDCSAKSGNKESEIKNKLFCNGYDSSIRPVVDHKTTTNIKVKMLIKSYDYSDHYSTLTLNTWMINRWKDEFLTWDSREYNDIKAIDISSSYIWRPDFSLYNADISLGLGTCHETNCLVESDGNVTCVEPCSFSGHCKSNYALWPFDRQNCSMVFGPWMNAQKEIDYIDDHISITSTGASEHTQWKLVSSGVIKKVTPISSNKKAISYFPSLSYYFLIERHSSTIFKIIGVALFTFVSLNMISLFIRNRQNQRMSLLMINVLLHFEMIHQMSWITPHNGEETPKILLFFRNSLIITCSLLVEALIVDSLFVCEAQPAERLRSIVNTIRTNQMMNLFLNSSSPYQQGGVVVGGGGSRGNVGRRRKDKANDDGAILVEEQEGQDGVDEEGEEEEVTGTNDTNVTVEDEETIKSSANREIWQFLALTIDRLLLAILLIIYVMSIFTLIPLARLATSNPINVEN